MYLEKKNVLATRIKTSALFHLFFPHNCIGCGSDVLDAENFLCLTCTNNLPYTEYAMHPGNPVEKKFWGRIPLAAAMSLLYFSQQSIVQNIIYEIKYRGNKEAGRFFGTLIGKSLLQSSRFDVDMIIPLPLFKKKEKTRRYNQSEIICRGIAEIIGKPVICKNVVRTVFTETQTKKHRIERWKNVDGIFAINNPGELGQQKILLVDDVVTTGATLDACGSAILQVPGTSLYIATLAFATR